MRSVNRVSLDKFFTTLIGILILYFSLIELTPVLGTGFIYTMFISTIAIIIFIYLLIARFDISNVKLLIPIALYLILFLLNLNDSPEVLLFQLLAFILFFVCSNLYWRAPNLKILHFFNIFVFIVLIGEVLFHFVVQPGTTEINLLGIANVNRVAMMSLTMSYFSIMYTIFYKKNFKKSSLIIWCSLVLLIVLLSGSRTGLISIVAILVTIFYWKKITASKLRFNMYFISVILIIGLITYIVPYASDIIPNFKRLNMIAFDITGKELYSGREVLWKSAFELISRQPLFGYGAGAELKDFTNTTLTTHNLFLQILLQVGFIGLISFISFLLFIWQSFWKNKNNKKVIISAGYLMGIIVYQGFEVTLVLSSVWFSFILWIIIGIMTSFTKYEDQT